MAAMATDRALYRVKVHLNQFYTNHKSKSYVMVDKEWKNVRQLHAHLNKLFHLDDKIYLITQDGVYLPGLYTPIDPSFLVLKGVRFICM